MTDAEREEAVRQLADGNVVFTDDTARFLLRRLDETRGALLLALKLCKCGGSGTYIPHCYKCDDSGEDHNDCPEERACETCAPLRAVLKAAS